MKLPPDFNEEEHKEAVLLEKSIYGLVQAALQWNKMVTMILKLLGFKQCKSDPCLLIHPDKIYSIIYVDDCLLVGKSEDLNKIVN